MSSQKLTPGSNSANYKQTAFNISPVVGKVIRENLVLGIDLGLSFYKQEQDNNSYKQKQNGYSAGVFLRHYKPIGKGFYLFLQERIGYRYETYDYNQNFSGPSNYKRNVINLSVNPGLSYSVSKKFHIETGFNNLLAVNYSHEKGINYNTSNTGKYKSNNFNAGIDLNGFNSLYIGFRILLGK